MVFIMNSDQYQRRPQMQGLATAFQYAENSGAVTQSPHSMISFDGLPRYEPEQSFLSTPSTEVDGLPDSYSLPSHMSMSQASISWPIPQIHSNFEDQNSDNYYGYSPNPTTNMQDSAFAQSLDFGVPRWVPKSTGVLDNSMALTGFSPSLYLIDPNKTGGTPSLSNTSALAFNPVENSHKHAGLSINRSPKMENDFMGVGRLSLDKPIFRMPSCETSDDERSSREMTAIDLVDQNTGEPYAKLIYRALMSTPNHSMVLQEIYQWFRENTTKGSSDTKGWMNSIRHNLSMNAAFKKTERKIPGDETKKSTEWVLEDFAVRDGVQSTTRYRSKGAGHKKFMKSENPTPSRQPPSRKRGISASRVKLLRQRNREECSDYRRSTQRQENRRRSQLRRSTGSRITQQQQRQSSPLTPPNPENNPPSSSYFSSKPEQFEVPYEGTCSLEDVQGIYIDDSPLFTNDQETHFPNDPSIANRRF